MVFPHIQIGPASNRIIIWPCDVTRTVFLSDIKHGQKENTQHDKLNNPWIYWKITSLLYNNSNIYHGSPTNGKFCTLFILRKPHFQLRKQGFLKMNRLHQIPFSQMKKQLILVVLSVHNWGVAIWRWLIGETVSRVGRWVSWTTMAWAYFWSCLHGINTVFMAALMANSSVLHTMWSIEAISMLHAKATCHHTLTAL